jgi:hypothetical protein
MDATVDAPMEWVESISMLRLPEPDLIKKTILCPYDGTIRAWHVTETMGYDSLRPLVRWLLLGNALVLC